MSIERVSSLSTADIDNLISIYGEDYSAAVNDLLNNTVPEGVESEDLFAWILENVGGDDIDPDSSSLDYLWADDDVVDMLHEFRDTNRANSDLENLISDVESYLEAAGEDIGTLSDAGRVIEDYVAEHGPLMYEGGSAKLDEELENLLAIVKDLNPALYMLLYVMFSLGPQITDALGEVQDKREDGYSELQDMIDDLDSYDQVEDQSELQQLQYEIQGLQSALRTYDQFSETLLETLNQMISTSSDMIANQGRTASFILGN